MKVYTTYAGSPDYEHGVTCAEIELLENNRCKVLGHYDCFSFGSFYTESTQNIIHPSDMYFLTEKEAREDWKRKTSGGKNV